MTNDDLISRSALMKYINENHSYAGLPMAAHICTMELLTYAPAVKAVEIVHGRWIHDDEYDICSNCNNPIIMNRLRPDRWCKNCGAKMDG